MKFLILIPFLLAPSLSQFQFLNDIGNSIKNVAESGAKTVENAALDGVHEVQKLGQAVGNQFKQVQKLGKKIGQLGQGVGRSISQTIFPPPAPSPQPEQKIPQVPVLPVPESPTQNLQKVQDKDDQSSSGSESSSSDSSSETDRSQSKKRGHKFRRHHKKPSHEKLQQMKKCREQMDKLLNEFNIMRGQLQKQGKEITQQLVEQHKKQMQELRKKLNQIKGNNENDSQKHSQQHNFQVEQEMSFDVINERIVMKEKLKNFQNMSPQEKEIVKEKMANKFMKQRESRRSRKNGDGEDINPVQSAYRNKRPPHQDKRYDNMKETISNKFTRDQATENIAEKKQQPKDLNEEKIQKTEQLIIFH